MEGIAGLLIVVAVFVVLFHEDYGWAEKIKVWYQKKMYGLQNWINDGPEL